MSTARKSHTSYEIFAAADKDHPARRVYSVKLPTENRVGAHLQAIGVYIEAKEAHPRLIRKNERQLLVSRRLSDNKTHAYLFEKHDLVEEIAYAMPKRPPYLYLYPTVAMLHRHRPTRSRSVSPRLRRANATLRGPPRVQEVVEFAVPSLRRQNATLMSKKKRSPSPPSPSVMIVDVVTPPAPSPSFYRQNAHLRQYARQGEMGSVHTPVAITYPSTPSRTNLRGPSVHYTTTQMRSTPTRRRVAKRLFA
ncbi:MAG: hypothetical protein WC763_05555 [Candidatus Paceibacterota bacterium]|jgi:hypothetical protein